MSRDETTGRTKRRPAALDGMLPLPLPPRVPLPPLPETPSSPSTTSSASAPRSSPVRARTTTGSSSIYSFQESTPSTPGFGLALPPLPAGGLGVSSSPSRSRTTVRRADKSSVARAVLFPHSPGQSAAPRSVLDRSPPFFSASFPEIARAPLAAELVDPRIGASEPSLLNLQAFPFPSPPEHVPARPAAPAQQTSSSSVAHHEQQDLLAALQSAPPTALLRASGQAASKRRPTGLALDISSPHRRRHRSFKHVQRYDEIELDVEAAFRQGVFSDSLADVRAPPLALAMTSASGRRLGDRPFTRPPRPAPAPPVNVQTTTSSPNLIPLPLTPTSSGARRSDVSPTKKIFQLLPRALRPVDAVEKDGTTALPALTSGAEGWPRLRPRDEPGLRALSNQSRRQSSDYSFSRLPLSPESPATPSSIGDILSRQDGARDRVSDGTSPRAARSPRPATTAAFAGLETPVAASSSAERILLELVADLRLLVHDASAADPACSAEDDDGESVHGDSDATAREQATLEGQIVEAVDDLAQRIGGFRPALAEPAYGPLAFLAQGYRVEPLYVGPSDEWPLRLADDLTALWRRGREAEAAADAAAAAVVPEGGHRRVRTTATHRPWAARRPSFDLGSHPPSAFARPSPLRQHAPTTTTAILVSSQSQEAARVSDQDSDGRLTSSAKVRSVVQVLLRAELAVQRDPLLGLLRGSPASEALWGGSE